MYACVRLPGATRQTNAERSARTRGALVDAASDLLVEHGWARVTSVAVCARAGLTRGAFVHHFDGLGDLFAAVLQDRYAEIEAMALADGEPTSIADLIERTWAITREPEFKVVLESWLAGANDPDLGRMLDPVVAAFAKLVGPDRWPHLLPDGEARSFYLVARESLLGLAWGRAINGGRPLAHETPVLDLITTTARTHDARLGHRGERP